MSFFKRLFGSEMVVDAMVGICVHDPDIFLEPPSNVRITASQSLSTAMKNASLSGDAKTAYFIVQGSMSFEEREKLASNDLPEQMNQFMKNNALKRDAYDIQFFSEDLRHDIKVLWAVAVRKN